MKPYPSYKDSGVKWIGGIPSGWSLKRLKFLFSLEGGKDPKKIQQEGGEFPIFGTGGEVGRGTDFLFNKPSILLGRKGTIDKPFVVYEPFWVSDVMYYTVQKSQMEPEYLLLMFTFIPFGYYKYGSTQPSMSRVDYENMYFPDPPLQEQQQISNYLDHKTRQIDTLIEKTQQTIELLKEQRTSLINRIVTKGLNPNVEMKDSGVEWIGGIPVHWISTRIKYYLYEVIDTEHKTVTFYDNGDYSVVRTTNIKNGKLVTDGIKKTNYDGFLEWTRRGIPSPGDVLLTREGPVGECCIVPFGFDFCMGQRVVWLKVKTKELVPQLLVHAIYSEQSKLFMDNISLGSTLSHLNMSEIGNIPIFIPPFQEQQQIVDYLDKETTKIDTLIEKENQRIDLLKEYRQSLISEVVTGKVDVRDEVFV
jgi:type I restriction enzyme, S subunit